MLEIEPGTFCVSTRSNATEPQSFPTPSKIVLRPALLLAQWSLMLTEKHLVKDEQRWPFARDTPFVFFFVIYSLFLFKAAVQAAVIK